ncbi:MAG: hypothetical protein JXA23_00555 [Bacteroidales bacterium]|nr:hypothetical protein [Bacteroidales bacterium]
MWTRQTWETTGPGPDQADLSAGVHIKTGFSDPEGRLETVYEDLRQFLISGNVSIDKGKYLIETRLSTDLEGESFRLEIGSESCRILAGDVEGIRRGIFNLEDEMLRIRGPYLPIGTIEKYPVVERRISRCTFAPTKHFPRYIDELMDDVNYYPDQYLNRIAHEGVNGLWLTVDFRDLVSTKFIPEAGKDAEKRLTKLKQTVNQCLRYGIRTYIFIIEPRAFGNQPPLYRDINVLDQYPELGGVRRGNMVYFCPMTESSQQYLYQCVNTIFRAVPDLGGLINITHGERATTCLSAVPGSSQHEGMINCPRCSKKEPWEILYASLSAMEKGMHDAAPDAELISWLYHPQTERGDWVYEIPDHTPEGVILQLNFESGVTRTEFGKTLKGGDYWLATPGPSQNFERQAEIARESGTKVSAKLQTGCSHEVASIPYVPVPSLVYRKFSAMHRLGVTHAMLGWYSGHYPGLMIKSAGLLSFEPLPPGEETFLQQLASIYWKEEDIPLVVEAWKNLAEGYGNFPLQNLMPYYGPMHDGPVRPLLLKPADAPLSPNWLLYGPDFKPWPPSGDRIGECLWGGGNRMGESMANELTLEENVELSRRMSTTWDKGVAILNKLEPKYRDEPERIMDIGLAKALGIQFRSGYNNLKFYMLREKMYRMEGMERLDILKQLGDIIRDELDLDKQLIKLCEKDSRLGFCSEAEGYKYFPEKIRWRMQQLKDALAKDLPELKKIIRDDKPLFPEYTGKEPSGAVAFAIFSTGPLQPDSDFNIPDSLQWQFFNYETKNSGLRWGATYDKDAMYIIVSDSIDLNQSANMSPVSGITVRIEPRRLWPSAYYTFKVGSVNPEDNDVLVVKGSDKRITVVRIPFKSFWWNEEEIHPLRIDVRVMNRDGEASSWRPNNPLPSRLVFGTNNPADLGWLVFNNN